MLTATRVIEMDDPTAAIDSSGKCHRPRTYQLPLLPGQARLERLPRRILLRPQRVVKEAMMGLMLMPLKSLRRDHADPRPSGSSHGGKSLAAIQLGLASVFVPEDAPAGVSDPDPLSFAAVPSSNGIAVAEDLESENASSPAKVGSPRSYFSELRHIHNEEFLGQYNLNLARQVAMGSQLRLRFEQEAKLLRKFIAQVARRDKRIPARELEIKNLEALLETEADMKKVAKDKSDGLIKELEDMCDRFSDLQVSNEHLSQHVATLQEQTDEELYPHMLIAIAGRRWVIGHGLRLAVMKYDESLEMRQAFADVVSTRIAKGMSEGLRHGVEYGHAQLNVESIEAYDPEAEAKFVAALQALKDLKYPLLDQLEGLKDAPIDLTIPVYPEVRDPRNPWAYKEEMKLADAIAAYISRAVKKKKCRIVCRTHGVGSAHHARSDGVPVSVPTVVPQGLALLLADVDTQTEFEHT
nr:hypothetical protein [Tanacetum cinerariifolium]